MTLRNFAPLTVVAGLFLAGSTASPATIDFESYADPTVLASFTDSGATFTPIGGADFSISAFGAPTWGTGAPQILCPRLAGSGNCESDFEVTFATDVANLRFYFTGDNSTLSLSVDAYLNGGLLGTVVVAADNSQVTAHLVDLSGFASIDRIVINEPGDPNGFGYDDFSFDAAAVPEPGSLILLGTGLAGLAARARRRRS